MNGSVYVQFLHSSNYVDTDAPSCTCVGNSLFKFKLQWHQFPTNSKHNKKRSGNGSSFYFLKANFLYKIFLLCQIEISLAMELNFWIKIVS